MPELPDIEAYIEALSVRMVGQELQETRLAAPFLLRTVDPPLSSAHGRKVAGIRRLGKRIVLELEGELFLVGQPCPACRTPVQRIVYVQGKPILREEARQIVVGEHVDRKVVLPATTTSRGSHEGRSMSCRYAVRMGFSSLAQARMAIQSR